MALAAPIQLAAESTWLMQAPPTTETITLTNVIPSGCSSAPLTSDVPTQPDACPSQPRVACLLPILEIMPSWQLTVLTRDGAPNSTLANVRTPVAKDSTWLTLSQVGILVLT